MPQPTATEHQENLKKRLCCPPLQAEVGIYDGLFDKGTLTVRQKQAYNLMIAEHLASLKEGREHILANP